VVKTAVEIMTDWRETLFVWKGILTIADNNNIEWKGSWVSTNDVMNSFPTDDDFLSSQNNFILYSSTITKHNNDSIDINFDRGHYLLDNGNGLETFSDINHNLYCIKHTDDRWYCYAKGDTEFGPFISKGIMTTSINNDDDCDDNNDNDINSTSYSLTLARRYVYSKKDSRLSLPIETSTKQMIEELSTWSSTLSSTSSSTTTSTTTTNDEPKPWLDLPMKDKKKPSKKRDRDHLHS